MSALGSFATCAVGGSGRPLLLSFTESRHSSTRAFGEHVSPPIGTRAVFVRAFSTGFPISGWAGELAYGEIRALTDLVERFLSSAPADVP
jgi:hypothetical protein